MKSTAGTLQEGGASFTTTHWSVVAQSALTDVPEAADALAELCKMYINKPADTGSNFRIDSCQYVYNLSASALGVGTYRVDILINGQVVGSASFALR